MIGQKIKELRLQNNLTQEELAQKMGYKSKSTINKIEKNVHDVNQATLIKFADVFGCDPTDLLIEVHHEDYELDQLKRYALMLSKLSTASRDNAIQYIKYLSEQEKKGDAT